MKREINMKMGKIINAVHHALNTLGTKAKKLRYVNLPEFGKHFVVFNTGLRESGGRAIYVLLEYRCDLGDWHAIAYTSRSPDRRSHVYIGMVTGMENQKEITKAIIELCLITDE